jgi:hypothetical protein
MSYSKAGWYNYFILSDQEQFSCWTQKSVLALFLKTDSHFMLSLMIPIQTEQISILYPQIQILFKRAQVTIVTYF